MAGPAAMAGVMSPGLRRPASRAAAVGARARRRVRYPGHRRGSARRGQIEHYLTTPCKGAEPAKRKVDVAYLTNQASSLGTPCHVLQSAFTTGNAHTAAVVISGPLWGVSHVALRTF